MKKGYKLYKIFPENAIEYLNKALELERNAENFYWRGISKFNVKLYANSKADFETVLERQDEGEKL